MRPRKRREVSGVIDVHSEEYILGQNISVQMAVCRFVSRKRTAAGVRPAMPMTRGRSPSNVPAI